MNRKFSIIDTDIHPVISPKGIEARLPEPWRSRYADGNRGPGTLGYWNPNGVMRADTKLPDGSKIEDDPESLARHFFDVYELEYGILNPAGGLHIGLSPDPDYAAAVVSALNDTVVEEWLPVDARFRASLVVSPADPHLAAKEIHRLGDQPGLVQVLMPSAARMPYGQRFYHPIYEAAVVHHLPVAIHPGTEGVGISGAPTAAGYPSTYFEWHTGLVGSYLAHLISLVSEGVFNKFPAMKFVLIEGGVSWVPPIMWRFDKNWKALRQTTPWVDRPPSEIISEHILLTTQPLEEPAKASQFNQILEMFDAGAMLMFSTDFPHWDGDTPDFAARAIPAGLRQRVMSETARELYGLPEVKHD
jgi:predicted TIM-barrel fold metal-dependent hydrolase